MHAAQGPATDEGKLVDSITHARFTRLHKVFRELEVCCYVEVSSSMTHNYKCLRASASAVWQGNA